MEPGITFPAQLRHLRKNLPTVVEDSEQNLTPRLRWLLDRLWQEWKQTEIDIANVTDEIERIGTEDERCRRLRQIPGLWPSRLHGHGSRHRQWGSVSPKARFGGLDWRRAWAAKYFLNDKSPMEPPDND